MIVRPAEAETRPQTAVTEVRGRIPVKDASVMEVWGQWGQSADSACARVHTRAKARIRHSGEVRRLQSTGASLGLARISAWAWRGYQPGPGEDMSVWARISALDWVTRHGWVTRAPAFHHLATNCQTVPIINSLSVVEKIKITASKALT